MVVYSNVRYEYRDLTNYDACERAVSGQDFVFMCASRTLGAAGMANKSIDLITTNIQMATNILRACYENNFDDGRPPQHKVQKIMMFGSTTSYPESNLPVKEDELFNGNPYPAYFAVGWMKRYTEKLCEHYTNIGLPALVLRPSNIYGAYDKFDPASSHVTPALVRKIAEHQNPLEVWGDGSEERDLIYVTDMADACLYFMERQAGYDPVNIGVGSASTIKEILTALQQIEGFAPKVEFNLNKPTMIPKRYVDITKAKQAGWYPKVSLRDGLEKTLRWYKENLL
jgi:GDP-L-fucose synthase